MTLLSKSSIIAALDDKTLEITPRPTDEAFETDSVDAHLGDAVYFWQKPIGGARTSIALAEGFDFKKVSAAYLKQAAPDNDGLITLRPGTFYLADLKEYIRLPPALAMHVQGRSSLARLGVGVHVTAPHAHAGWSGKLTLEIYNYGPFNIEVCPGIKIAQLTFWRVENPDSQQSISGQHQFTGQTNASGNAT